MSITKTAQTPIPSQSLAVGAAVLQSNWLPINAGVSGGIKASCTALPASGTPTYYIELAQDSSGTGAMLFTPGLVALTPSATGTAVGSFASSSFSFGVGGNNGDWSHYRVSVNPPSTNPVTVECQAETTTIA